MAQRLRFLVDYKHQLNAHGTAHVAHKAGQIYLVPEATARVALEKGVAVLAARPVGKGAPHAGR